MLKPSLCRPLYSSPANQIFCRFICHLCNPLVSRSEEKKKGWKTLRNAGSFLCSGHLIISAWGVLLSVGRRQACVKTKQVTRERRCHTRGSQEYLLVQRASGSECEAHTPTADKNEWLHSLINAVMRLLQNTRRVARFMQHVHLDFWLIFKFPAFMLHSNSLCKTNSREHTTEYSAWLVKN